MTMQNSTAGAPPNPPYPNPPTVPDPPAGPIEPDPEPPPPPPPPMPYPETPRLPGDPGVEQVSDFSFQVDYAPVFLRVLALSVFEAAGAILPFTLEDQRQDNFRFGSGLVF
jgi:hypothetical protein